MNLSLFFPELQILQATILSALDGFPPGKTSAIGKSAHMGIRIPRDKT